MATEKPQRIVMKFGGTSMAGTERIRRVAGLVRGQAAGKDGVRNEVAVVVSAMAGETDRLVNLCREANPLYDPAEYDVVVASGEQVTSGLLALTLQSLGEKARSWLGWQIPIRTIEAHSKARVETIEAPGMIEALGEGEDHGRGDGPVVVLHLIEIAGRNAQSVGEGGLGEAGLAAGVAQAGAGIELARSGFLIHLSDLPAGFRKFAICSAAYV